MNNLKKIDILTRTIATKIRLFNKDLSRVTGPLPFSLHCFRSQAPWLFCWGCCYGSCCACSSEKARRALVRSRARARKTRRGWA